MAPTMMTTTVMTTTTEDISHMNNVLKPNIHTKRITLAIFTANTDIPVHNVTITTMINANTNCPATMRLAITTKTAITAQILKAPTKRARRI